MKNSIENFPEISITEEGQVENAQIIINKIEDPYGGGVGLTNDKKKDALKFLDEQCLPQYGTKQQLRPGAKPNIFGRAVPLDALNSLNPFQ